LAHPIGTRQIGLHSALGKPLDCLPPLVRSELKRAPKLHTAGLCSLTAIIGAGSDELALEFGQAAKHSQH
jgi:hypothetical protein